MYRIASPSTGAADKRAAKFALFCRNLKNGVPGGPNHPSDPGDEWDVAFDEMVRRFPNGIPITHAF